MSEARVPSKSFAVNAVYQLNPINYNFFDWAGLATAGYATDLGKLASLEGGATVKTFKEALIDQVKDPVNRALGFPVTGLWAEGSALSSAAEAKPNDKTSAAVKDFGTSLLNVGVAIGGTALFVTFGLEVAAAD